MRISITDSFVFVYPGKNEKGSDPFEKEGFVWEPSHERWTLGRSVDGHIGVDRREVEARLARIEERLK